MGLSEEEKQQVSKCLRALAEPRRMDVFNLILDEAQCNRSIGDALAMQPSLVSYHLEMLERAGLIWAQRDERDARRVYYFARPEALALINRAFSGFYRSVRPA